MLLKVEVLTFGIFFSLNHTPAVQKVKMAALFFFSTTESKRNVSVFKKALAGNLVTGRLVTGDCAQTDGKV